MALSKICVTWLTLSTSNKFLCYLFSISMYLSSLPSIVIRKFESGLGLEAVTYSVIATVTRLTSLGLINHFRHTLRVGKLLLLAIFSVSSKD